MFDLNKKATEIFEQNKAVGWWDDPNRCIFTTLQLVSTEIAEATEGERKDLNDDHLPDRKMGEVELADALIRVLDLGGRCGWIFKEETRTVLEYGDSTVGRLHLSLNSLLIDLSDTVLMHEDKDGGYYKTHQHSRDYSRLIKGILKAAKTLGYDIVGAVDEKLAYNAKRADHKRENRAKQHGKAF